MKDNSHLANVDREKNIYKDCLQVQKVRNKNGLKLVTITEQTNAIVWYLFEVFLWS